MCSTLEALAMTEPNTTAEVQHYLDELLGIEGNSPTEPIIRALLGRAVRRLQFLCTTLLNKSYPRLTRPPLNLQTEEVLGALVERLLKAMRETRPETVRQFFGLANQHIRWELNDLARRLDEQMRPVSLPEEGAVAASESSGSGLSANARRMLEAIENLPDDEREAFGLVRIQGMSHTQAGEMLGVSAKTIQRRLNRSLMQLTQSLSDLR
jgi:RNA polymerase sigma factor (sigma-70 family)